MFRLFFACFLLLSSVVFAKILPATQLKSTQIFIDKMVEKHRFDKDELLEIFSHVKLSVITDKAKIKAKKAKKRKRKPMAWNRYKNLFLTKNRIQNGVKFWHANLATLQRAEKTYHVPVEIIVAILGIETNYGKNKGAHPTLRTLTKRAFGSHRRRRFYQKELESFLLMSRENALPPLSVKGSYAGAMGYPQFIASSYRHYAVDFNKDGKIDLFSDPIDAIGSIAHYFDQHQWHDFGEIARPIALDAAHLQHAKRSTNKPKKNAQHWRTIGLKIDTTIADKTKLAFIRLPQQKTDDTWLTFWNFYVLTRYNHDNKYAMAVYQLSQLLKQKFNSNTH